MRDTLILPVPAGTTDSPYRELGRGSLFCKRFFDVTVALVALVATAPLFLLLAVLIKLDSPGPVFYRQIRIGRHRRRFLMWKFRKMPHEMPVQGPSLTRRYDARLTRVGRLLERTKLDELPQLLNVLRGDMSIVGPRPEVPRFVEHYPEMWDRVLSVRPGLVGSAQLQFRNESEMYPGGCADLEGYYARQILPGKLAIDAAYAERHSPWGDAFLLVWTVLVTLAGMVTRQTLYYRRWQLLRGAVLAVLAIGATLVTARVLGPRFRLNPASYPILLVIFARLLCLVAFKLPNSLATSVTADDLLRCCRCAVASGLLGACGLLAGGDRDLIGLMLAVDVLMFLSFLIVYKLVCYNIYVCFRLGRSGNLGRRLPVASLLLGPMSTGAALLAARAFGGFQGVTAASWLVPILGASVVRPCVLLFSPVASTRPLSRWLLTAWVRLALDALVGTCILALLGLVFVGRIATGWEVLLTDSALYLALLTGCALWPARSPVPLSQEATDSGRRHPATEEKVLLVGAGIELGAYVSVLSALPEGCFRVVGAVMPRPGYRTNTVGGVPILGDLTHAAEIIQGMQVTRVIVVGTAGGDAMLAYLRAVCPLANDSIISVDLLGPIPSGWRWDPSSQSQRDAAHLPPRQTA